ncbi:MerR family transcriptional regulator [Aeromicrobium sp. PE09-221]|uniref:MerR family transcriptional regulator n=1 Tax=Aeromicrobium sp. PE09-221 TaxID=1898043 RepID=UPI000B3EAEA0|nr:MerR family transcriptional regulator [Aeromicrobium sp. PE09-221]OUZ12822.1 MerR family transcriptional regulator [Aeromicrobium sp. PE09-221]
MRIGELAALTGVSARALRHYEDCGLLLPARTSGGYRDYADEDVTRVAQITAMIAAGVGTATIKCYLDCVRVGEHGASLKMCPDLRAELDLLGRRLDARQAELQETQQRLNELTSAR